MYLRSVTKHAIGTLAVAACVFVAPGVRAGEASNDQSAASIEYFVSVSGVCHPARGACPKNSQRVAGSAKENSTTPALDEVGPFDRYAVSSACHPAYTPSWMMCANRARTIQTADLAK